VVPPDQHILIADAPRETAPSYKATVLGLHAPRGPPALLS
jgi:hypothetical protein